MRGLVAVVPFVAGCDLLFQVQHVDAVDAGLVDATDAVDVSPADPPAVVASKSGACSNCASLTVSFTTVPARPTSVLVVSIAVGLATGVSPHGNSVTYGTSTGTLIARGSDTATSAQPVLEQWLIVSPPVGTSDVVVQLTNSAASLLVGIAQSDGARASNPVRMFATAASISPGKMADNTVASATGDLVIDAVCAGSSIDAAGSSQTVIKLDNVNGGTTCANLASSWVKGAPVVSLHWDVNNVYADHWIDVASSIAPGP